MYYGWDHTAYYFSPYHICTIRGGITCEGWN
jgi:hypothetical protein